MTASSIYLNTDMIAWMCEKVVPRTDAPGACAIFDDASPHNKILESFFLAVGRTPLRVQGGATGIKQVGDDENFNGRKKHFCRSWVAKRRVDALLSIPEEQWATYRTKNIVTPDSVCEMIQACINQPGNLSANFKSLAQRLPTLSGTYR